MAGNTSGVLLSWNGSITHPGKQEQHGSGMTGQHRQGEELEADFNWETCDFKSMLYWTGNIPSHSSAYWPLFSSVMSTV